MAETDEASCAMSLLTDALEGPGCWSKPAGLATTPRTSSTTSSGGWRGARCLIKKNMRQKCSCFSCLKLFLKLCCWYIQIFILIYIHSTYIFYIHRWFIYIYISYKQILSIGVLYTHVYCWCVLNQYLFIAPRSGKENENRCSSGVYSPVRGEMRSFTKSHRRLCVSWCALALLTVY